MLQRINKQLLDKIIHRMNTTPENMVCKQPKNRKIPKRGVLYFNQPISFDIETSSFYINGDKYSLCYMWQMKIENVCIYGRRLFEFSYTINKIADSLKCGYKDKHIIIYVHNLGYEFQFIRKYFSWETDSILCNSPRSVIQAITTNGIEFRCSYSLSGVSLEQLAKELTTKRMRKSKDLDYKLLRHSKTPLTHKEMKYCELDVKIVWQYIHEKLLLHKEIYDIPLTKTGYPRKALKKRYSGAGSNADEYRNQMKDLVMTTDEYKINRHAYMGGFTFASPHNRGQILRNVVSYDINSDYPYQMVVGYYPVSNGTLINAPSAEEFYRAITEKCCLMDITFRNINASNMYIHYLMKEKIRKEQDTRCIYYSGRLIQAKGNIRVAMTEIDFELVNKLYRYEDIKVNRIITYERRKLPREMVLAVLDWYNAKTELKGVKGKESEFSLKKQMLNANYGVHVTNPCKERELYNAIAQRWEGLIGEDKEYKTLDEYIEDRLYEYNYKRNEKIVWYPIGVYVCAHARKTLLDLSIDLGNLYVYSDTDSNKFIKSKSGIEELIVAQHNTNAMHKVKDACDYYNIPFSLCRPKNRLLGQWEKDGEYKLFKTLGCKRYMYIPFKENEEKRITQEEAENFLKRKPSKRDHIQTTVAGTSPDKLPEKFLHECNTYKDVFNAFDFGLHIEPEYTGKLTHTYIDEIRSGVICDYLGNEGEFYTPSGIHLEECCYDMRTETSDVLTKMTETSDLFDMPSDDIII